MKKIHIEKTQRIPWLNLSIAYIRAAEAISKKIVNSEGKDKDQWENQVVILPLLFLLRHALELSLKSFFISYDVPFEKTHDLEFLATEAEQYINLATVSNIEKWSKITKIVKEFSETTYGGQRLFTNNDTESFALKYVQTNTLAGYEELKNIKHTELIEKVKTARMLCESFTFITDTKFILINMTTELPHNTPTSASTESA
jgi:hypothetical protein